MSSNITSIHFRWGATLLPEESSVMEQDQRVSSAEDLARIGQRAAASSDLADGRRRGWHGLRCDRRTPLPPATTRPSLGCAVRRFVAGPSWLSELKSPRSLTSGAAVLTGTGCTPIDAARGDLSTPFPPRIPMPTGSRRRSDRGSAWPHRRRCAAGGRVAIGKQTTVPAGDPRNLNLIQGYQCSARQAGFEPATVGLEVRCSIQLSYWRPAGPLSDATPAVRIPAEGGHQSTGRRKNTPNDPSRRPGIADPIQ